MSAIEQRKDAVCFAYAADGADISRSQEVGIELPGEIQFKRDGVCMLGSAMGALWGGAQQKRSLVRCSQSAGGRKSVWGLVLGTCMVINSCLAGDLPASSPASQTKSVLSSPSPLIDHKGSTEWSVTGGGATNIAGGASGDGFGILDLRWGHILTNVSGLGPLRGTLEYAVEIVPVLVIKQRTNVFGGGINPLVLQYNFTHGGRVVPFIQAGAGMLFTTQKVPEGTSQFNFTPQGGIGVYLFRRSSSAVATGVRYHHISNAGRTNPNPGRNSLYFYTGISWWR